MHSEASREARAPRALVPRARRPSAQPALRSEEAAGAAGPVPVPVRVRTCGEGEGPRPWRSLPCRGWPWPRGLSWLCPCCCPRPSCPAESGWSRPRRPKVSAGRLPQRRLASPLRGGRGDSGSSRSPPRYPQNGPEKADRTAFERCQAPRFPGHRRASAQLPQPPAGAQGPGTRAYQPGRPWVAYTHPALAAPSLTGATQFVQVL